jgi:hypothetical protein
MPISATSPRRIVAREREQRALALRREGLTMAGIAAALGMSRAGAHRAVVRALDATKREIAEEADALRALQLERIEAGIRALWPAYVRGELGAVDRMVRLLDRQARLCGLDLRPPDHPRTEVAVVFPSFWSGAGRAPEVVEQEPLRQLHASEDGADRGRT